MAQTAEHIEIVPPILSRHEAFQIFDAEVRRLMGGMSGEEFMRRWDAGEFDEVADEPGNRHIMRLALMMPGDGRRSS
jgi:hypothetical protein